MHTKAILGVAVVALAAVTAPAGAQPSCNAAPGATCSVSHTLETEAPEIAKLTQFSENTVFLLTADDFDNPAGAEAFGPGLEVEANVAWAVSVETATPTWTGTSSSKPSTDLRIDLGGGSLLALNTTAQPYIAGSAGKVPYPAALFNSLWYLESDSPGTYLIEVIFTLSTP
jgi:hypothetical protein